MKVKIDFIQTIISENVSACVIIRFLKINLIKVEFPKKAKSNCSLFEKKVIYFISIIFLTLIPSILCKRIKYNPLERVFAFN